MPQTLVRTSMALNVDDCEIQAASALQQMKGFPTLNNRFPPVIGPPRTILPLSVSILMFFFSSFYGDSEWIEDEKD